MEGGKYIREKGFCTFTELQKFLGIPQGSHSLLTKHLKALGIVLEPFKREGKYVTKQYKSRKRALTIEEATAAIKRWRALEGRDEEA